MTVQDNFLKTARLAFGHVGRNTSHLNRFRNLDGSPYGSTGLARVMLTPDFQVNMAVITLVDTLSARAAHGPAAWVTDIASAAGVCFLGRKAIDLRQKRSLVIDTEGKLSDPSAQNEAKTSLKRTEYIMAAGGVLCSALGIQPINWFLLFNSTTAWLRESKLRPDQWTVTSEPPPPRVPEPKPAKGTKPINRFA